MDDLGFSPRRWLARGRPRSARAPCALSVIAAPGCATQTTGGVGAAGGPTDRAEWADRAAARPRPRRAPPAPEVRERRCPRPRRPRLPPRLRARRARRTVFFFFSEAPPGRAAREVGAAASCSLRAPPNIRPSRSRTTSSRRPTRSPRGPSASPRRCGRPVTSTSSRSTSPTSSCLTIGAGDGLGGCPAGAKTYLRVYDAKQRGDRLRSGHHRLRRPHALEFPGLASLPLGPYVVKVGAATAIPSRSRARHPHGRCPAAATGTVQVGSGEQCDDQNTLSGDGCAADCVIEGGSSSTKSRRTTPRARATQSTATTAWSVNRPGQQSGLVHADRHRPRDRQSSPRWGTASGAARPASTPSSRSTASLALLTSDDNGGVGGCSKISPSTLVAASNLPAGVYGLKVEEYGNNATTPFYVLTASVLPPGCGDGISKSASSATTRTRRRATAARPPPIREELRERGRAQRHAGARQRAPPGR